MEPTALTALDAPQSSVLVGQFKRGKSALIDALLDRDLLPTGVAITEVR